MSDFHIRERIGTRTSDRLASTFCWSKDPSTAWYLPQQKIPLAENRFLQAGKGA
jgi:hypothetical protein